MWVDYAVTSLWAAQDTDPAASLHWHRRHWVHGSPSLSGRPRRHGPSSNIGFGTAPGSL